MKGPKGRPAEMRPLGLGGGVVVVMVVMMPGRGERRR
jgi:hypothetical protein